MIKRSYTIKGFDCAHCAAKSEAHLNKHPDIEKASIDFATDRLDIIYRDKVLEIEDIKKTIADCGLEGVENINYLQAIKRVIGMINKPLAN